MMPSIKTTIPMAQDSKFKKIMSNYGHMYYNIGHCPPIAQFGF